MSMASLCVEAVIAQVKIIASLTFESGAPDGSYAATVARHSLVARRYDLHFGYQARPVLLLGEIYRQVVSIGSDGYKR